MTTQVDKALAFATGAHCAVGQKRRYSGQDYIIHPATVYGTLLGHGITDDATLAAALLHDVVEDTQVLPSQLAMVFTDDVVELVGWLTDTETGNRADRKAAGNLRLSRAPAEAQAIKLADLIDNTRDIVTHDPDFARTYLREKAVLLPMLTKAKACWPSLYTQAERALEAGFAAMGMD